MPARKIVSHHVRALTWGLGEDLDYLEYVGGRLNSIDTHRLRFLHFSGRRPDAELQQREHFGSPRRAAQQAAQTYGALCAVQAILAPSMPLAPAPSPLHRETARRFSCLEHHHPARLALSDMSLAVGGREQVVEITRASYTDGDPWSEATFTAWLVLGLRERDRLKRCARCRAWFVDHMRSKQQVWCSSTCHDAGWSRSRRRASLAQHGKRSRRKRTLGPRRKR